MMSMPMSMPNMPSGMPTIQTMRRTIKRASTPRAVSATMMSLLMMPLLLPSCSAAAAAISGMERRTIPSFVGVDVPAIQSPSTWSTTSPSPPRITQRGRCTTSGRPGIHLRDGGCPRMIISDGMEGDAGPALPTSLLAGRNEVRRGLGGGGGGSSGSRLNYRDRDDDDEEVISTAAESKAAVANRRLPPPAGPRSSWVLPFQKHRPILIRREEPEWVLAVKLFPHHLPTFFHHRPLSPSSTSSEAGASSSTPSTSSLFAQSGGEGDRDGEGGDEEPAWVRALRFWSSSATGMGTGEGEAQDQPISSEPLEADPAGPPPQPPLGVLGRLVNVEALLFASGAADAGDAGMGDLIDFIYDNEEGRLAGLEGDSKGVGEEVVPSSASAASEGGEGSSPSSLTDGILGPLASLPSLDVVAGWDEFVQNLLLDVARATSEQKEGEEEDAVEGVEGGGIKAVAEQQPVVADELASKSSAALDLDGILRDATRQVEGFVSDASSILSPSTVRDLIVQAGNRVLALNTEDASGQLKYLMSTAQSLSERTGLDMREATELARATTGYAVDLARFANDVLVAGYVPSVAVAAAAAPQSETGVRGDEDGATTADGAAALSPSSAPNATAGPKALLDGFDVAAVSGTDEDPAIRRAAELSRVAAAIYEKPTMVEELRAAGHTFVAAGVTCDVAWLVTDSVVTVPPGGGTEEGGAAGSETTTLARTITVRGFDATDDGVDRLRLLDKICDATPEWIDAAGVGGGAAAASATSSATAAVNGEGKSATKRSDSSDDSGEEEGGRGGGRPDAELERGRGRGVWVHTGLLSIAREIRDEVAPYVDGLAPSHRLVLNGHSIGGSISVLMLMLLVLDRGVDFVRDRVLNVFTFGAPPIATTTVESIPPNDKQKVESKPQDLPTHDTASSEGDQSHPPRDDDILHEFGLPEDLVRGYVQPWDPVVRLFTEIDPLYPLVDDLGEDGVTLFSSGPPRTLRPVTRAILESWEDWPRFRDTRRATLNQRFVSVGRQYLLLPEPIRYLTDRLVSVNLAVPPAEQVVSIPSRQLVPALERAFPLDVFGISFVPAAIRSFVHHFHPAYTFPLVSFAGQGGEGGQKVDVEREATARAKSILAGNDSNAGRSETKGTNNVDLFSIDWADAATDWILGNTEKEGRGNES